MLNPSKIAIVFPSGKVNKTKFNLAKNIFSKLNIKVFNPQETEISYLAGNDDLRLQSLIDAIEDPEIKILLAARGGYGAIRLDFNKLKQKLLKHPKPIMGFSDITVLHAFWNKLGLKSVHGAVFTQFATLNEKNININLEFLSNFKIQISQKINSIEKLSEIYINGIITGGNIATLETLIGTDLEPTFKDKIVFLEEIGEVAYKLDRMLTHLFLSTDLNQAKAFILGEFIQCKDFSFNIFKNLFTKFDITQPCFYNFPAGHGQKNIPLLFGEEITIVGKNQDFIFKQNIKI